MSVTVDRQQLLQRLDAVQPGLSQGNITQQSGCFVFIKGRIYTYNEDISCRIKSGLPKEMTGAVIARPLMDALNKKKTQTVRVEFEEDRMVISDKRGSRTRLLLEREIKLPVEKVESPNPEGWKNLADGFNDAVSLVIECASKDESRQALTCIHIYPKWVEACDDLQMARHRILTGFETPILIKRDAIKHIVSMEMSEFNETEKWIHFRNSSGVILSCIRYTDPYPHDHITKLFKEFNGQTCNLPKGLESAVDVAEVFTKEDPDDDQVTIVLENGTMTVIGVGLSGDHTEPKPCNYAGKRLEFKIGPKLLKEIGRKHPECKVSKTKMMIEANKWRYLTSLTAAKKKGEMGDVVVDESEPQEDEDA